MAGILPTIWMIGVGFLFGIAFIIMRPRGLEIVKPFIIAGVALAILVPVHRVSRTRIIKHFIRWHDAGIGGRQGRDLNPAPHRFYTMTDEETRWMRQQRSLDAKRAKEIQQSRAAMNRAEAQRKALKRRQEV